MKDFIIELMRIEIDDSNHLFNGFSNVESYYNYMNKLFLSANLVELTDDKQAKATQLKLMGFEDAIEAVGMYDTTITALEYDSLFNRKLRTEVDWYKTIYGCLGIKRMYYDRIVELINKDNIETRDKTTETSRDNQILGENGYYNAKDLCRIFPQLSYNNVKNREWRKNNNFPFNPEYKGKQMYSKKKVEEWIEKNLEIENER